MFQRCRSPWHRCSLYSWRLWGVQVRKNGGRLKKVPCLDFFFLLLDLFNFLFFKQIPYKNVKYLQDLFDIEEGEMFQRCWSSWNRWPYLISYRCALKRGFKSSTHRPSQNKGDSWLEVIPCLKNKYLKTVLNYYF